MKQQMFTRMIIGEAMTDAMACDVVGQFADLGFSKLARYGVGGLNSARVLHEDGGRMVVFELTFESRDAAVKFSSDDIYRLLVTRTAHYLVGDFINKLFAVA